MTDKVELAEIELDPNVDLDSVTADRPGYDYEHKGQTIHQEYTQGKIVEFSWGYDQTNIDFFKIVRRTKRYVWLQPIGQKAVEDTGWMQGTCLPNPDSIVDYRGDSAPIKRIVHVWDGKEKGVAIESYGWASLWDGEPSRWSSYH